MSEKCEAVDSLVSVMVPAYNASSTIVDALDSVWNQSYRPIELIIINDGSTDVTGRVIEEWAASRHSEDFDIILRTQTNQGLLKSRSRGLSLSRGSYLQFMDADDVLHPAKVARCVTILADRTVDVAVPRTEKFRFSSEIADKLMAAPREQAWATRELRRSTITRTWWHSIGPLFRRGTVEAVGGFPVDVHPVAEELEFHGRVKLSARRIVYLNEVLNFYRTGNQQSVTGTLAQLYDGRIEGARIAKDLLQSHRVRRWNEWSSLLEMAVRTYYQTVCCTDDRTLQDRAWEGIREVASAWSPILRLVGLPPRGLCDVTIRGAWKVKRVVRSATNRLQRSTHTVLGTGVDTTACNLAAEETRLR